MDAGCRSCATTTAARCHGTRGRRPGALAEPADGFAAGTGCTPDSVTLEEEPVFEAASEQLAWTAFAARRLLFVVLGTDRASTKRVAGSVLRQLGEGR